MIKKEFIEGFAIDKMIARHLDIDKMIARHLDIDKMIARHLDIEVEWIIEVNINADGITVLYDDPNDEEE